MSNNLINNENDRIGQNKQKFFDTLEGKLCKVGVYGLTTGYLMSITVDNILQENYGALAISSALAFFYSLAFNRNVEYAMKLEEERDYKE